jgi:hypothetical protein
VVPFLHPSPGPNKLDFLDVNSEMRFGFIRSIPCKEGGGARIGQRENSNCSIDLKKVIAN